MTTETSPYAILTGAGDWTYRFASAYGAAELLRLNDADAYGCLWACDEPEGWAAAPAVTTLDERQYGDGAYAGDTTYGPRTLTWEGTTTCPTRAAQRAAMSRLRSVAQARGALLYTQDEHPVPQSLWVRSSGQPKIRALDELVFDWSFIKVAEDPLKINAAEAATTLSTMLPQVPPGRVYNRVYNYLYGALSADSDGELVVVNSGDEWGQAVYTVRGPADRPTIVNASTGQFIGLDLALAANDQVVIDTASGLVLFNGTPYYGALTPGSSFPLIAPDPYAPGGANSIRWSALTTNTTARLSVNTASTWK